LALGPTVVLGQFGQAGGELLAQATQLVKQVLAMLHHALRPLAGEFEFFDQRRRGALCLDPQRQCSE
jgi:hypothetical protein